MEFIIPGYRDQAPPFTNEEEFALLGLEIKSLLNKAPEFAERAPRTLYMTSSVTNKPLERYPDVYSRQRTPPAHCSNLSVSLPSSPLSHPVFRVILNTRKIIVSVLFLPSLFFYISSFCFIPPFSLCLYLLFLFYSAPLSLSISLVSLFVFTNSSPSHWS